MEPSVTIKNLYFQEKTFKTKLLLPGSCSKTLHIMYISTFCLSGYIVKSTWPSSDTRSIIWFLHWPVLKGLLKVFDCFYTRQIYSKNEMCLFWPYLQNDCKFSLVSSAPVLLYWLYPQFSSDTVNINCIKRILLPREQFKAPNYKALLLQSLGLVRIWSFILFIYFYILEISLSWKIQ